MQKLSEDMKQTVMDIFEHLHANLKSAGRNMRRLHFSNKSLRS